MLENWKKLPAYKAETRIDSLVGYYLKTLLNEFIEEEIIGIIPELPIRKGTIHPEYEGTVHAERSFKVDFFAVGGKGVNYLIEFKSDSGSRRDGQDLYLKNSQDLGTKALMEGIVRIASVSPYTRKYDHLLKSLQEVDLLSPIKKYTGKNPDLEILYVQPSNNNNAEDNIIDFIQIASWLEDQTDTDSFELELAAALRIWAND